MTLENTEFNGCTLSLANGPSGGGEQGVQFFRGVAVVGVFVFVLYVSVGGRMGRVMAGLGVRGRLIALAVGGRIVVLAVVGGLAWAHLSYLTLSY